MESFVALKGFCFGKVTSVAVATNNILCESMQRKFGIVQFGEQCSIRSIGSRQIPQTHCKLIAINEIVLDLMVILANLATEAKKLVERNVDSARAVEGQSVPPAAAASDSRC